MANGDGVCGLSRREVCGAAAAALASAALPVRAVAEASGGVAADPDWTRFCRALESLGGLVPADADPLTRAEGLRCLSRLLALGFDRFIEFGDARHPVFYDLQTAVRKYLGDNPDQTYRAASIEGSGTYRIRGNLSGAAGAALGVFAGTFRSDDTQAGGGRHMVGTLDETQLAADRDGSFVATLSPSPADGPWIRLSPDANYVLLRTYFWDRAVRNGHAMPSIERLDVSGPAPPVGTEEVLRGLLATVSYVEGSLRFWQRWFRRDDIVRNGLAPMPDDGTIQTPGNVAYLEGRVVLEEDEALILDLRPRDPPPYWSLVLQGPWGETSDWRDRPISLNNRQLVTDAGGGVRVIISHRRVEAPNWLDMAGRRENLLALRWRGRSPPPETKSQLVKAATLEP